MLTKQAFYFLRHTSSPFFFGYFGDGIVGANVAILLGFTVCLDFTLNSLV
jgi:hypothetical protein